MNIIITTPSAQSLKRLWRRRRYQRLRTTPSSTGGPAFERSRTSFRLGRLWCTRRRASKLRLKIASPVKLLAKFHDAYVEMMMRVAKSVGNVYGKRIPKPHQVSQLVSCGGEQVVDAKLVLEIYNRLAASKNMGEKK